nr:MAG TPA: hypothetical protein [Caudoviricetes sp.]
MSHKWPFGLSARANEESIAANGMWYCLCKLSRI